MTSLIVNLSVVWLAPQISVTSHIVNLSAVWLTPHIICDVRSHIDNTSTLYWPRKWGLHITTCLVWRFVFVHFVCLRSKMNWCCCYFFFERLFYIKKVITWQGTSLLSKILILPNWFSVYFMFGVIDGRCNGCLVNMSTSKIQLMYANLSVNDFNRLHAMFL